MKRIRRHFIFSGRVQGVGFRYSAMYLAQSLGLTGWVKNCWDGTVEMEAQGDPESVALLLSHLHSRSFIRIEHVVETDIPLEEEHSFLVK